MPRYAKIDICLIHKLVIGNLHLVCTYQNAHIQKKQIVEKSTSVTSRH